MTQLPTSRSATRRPQTVSVSQVTGLVEYLQQRQISADTLFASLPLSKDILEDRAGRIGVDEWLSMFARAAELLDDPHLGMNLGISIKPGSYGLLGYLAMNCDSLQAVLDRIQRFSRLVGEVGIVEVVDHGEMIEARWQANIEPYPEQLAEWNVTAWMGFGRWITASQLNAAEVWFPHDRGNNQAELEQHFGCKVMYNKPFASLWLPREKADLPVMHADDDLRRMLDEQVQRQLRAISGSLEFTRVVENALLEALREGDSSLPTVAKQLGLSPRSLQRRLRETGSSYQEALDETRRNLALEYIRDSRHSLLEISQRLGFAEQSSFNRAFRRWTGDTPSNYRWRR